jgi:CDP-diacylglycerol--glycerol-3-phosphate 3-phosphatidyltransferase/cardiolipin synthase
MDRAATRPLLLSLPNVLTYGRILAVPALAVCFLLIKSDFGRWASFLIFAAACVTDWLDGYLARAWQQQSTLGRMLDPIADKLLVGTALLLLVHDNTIDNATIWAALIILCREILVSGLREFLAELNVKIHVTQLTKWKTTLQMIALGILIIGPAGEKHMTGVLALGTAFLWVAALLTLWTGYGYLKAAIIHAIEHQ